MASATLAFSSCLCSTSAAITQKQRNPISVSVSKTNLTFHFPQVRTLSPLLSNGRKPTFPFVPRAAETEAPVIESETSARPPRPLKWGRVRLGKPRQPVKQPEESVSESDSEAPSEPAPKREEIFAVVMIGSRQYIVFPGRWIYVPRLKGANVNDKVILNKVLLVGTKDSTYVGKPVVTSAAVHAIVEDQLLDKKVIVFKYKPKKNYRRNIGHRQPITRIRITGITGYEDYPASTLDS